MVENLHQIYFIMNVHVNVLKEQPCSFYFGNMFNYSRLAAIFFFLIQHDYYIEKKKNNSYIGLFFSFHFFRVSMFAHSSEQLLGYKDSQRESLTLLDAKELLKYFTPEGLPVGDLQPLQIPKRYASSILKPLKTILRTDVGECEQWLNESLRMA